MNIELRNNMVYLYNPGASSPIDSFRGSDMARALQMGKYEVSEYIYLLSRKSWMDKVTLYELAEIIQGEFPKNKINWKETFYPIEKQEFIDELFEEYQRSIKPIEENDNSLFHSLKIKMQLGIEIEKEGKAEVLKKLKINLNHHGLC